MTTIEFQFKLVSLQENLMKFAYKLTSDTEEANDLLQETFLRALKYCNKFAHGSNFKAWVFTIMKNTFINNYRRIKNQNSINNLPAESYSLSHQMYSSEGNSESLYASKELEKAIEALDEIYKQPFKMYHEGFKYREIAEELDINIGTVKSRIFLARKELMIQTNR